MKTKAAKKDLTLCLGHGLDDRPNGCELANKCARHLELCKRNFPDGANIVGAACVAQGHPLFVAAENGRAAS